MKRTAFLLSTLFYLLSCRMVNISNDLLSLSSEDFVLNRGGTLSFSNTNGDTELNEWNESFIRVETRIYGDSCRGIPEDLQILTRDGDNELAFSVEYPGGLSYNSVDFTVSIPRDAGFLINCETVNGTTSISAEADVYVESVNGDILVRALSSRGLFAVNGDIDAELSGQTGDLAIETVNGDILVKLPENLGLSVETVNGDLMLRGRSYSSSVSIPGALEAVASIETVLGDITVENIL